MSVFVGGRNFIRGNFSQPTLEIAITSDFVKCMLKTHEDLRCMNSGNGILLPGFAHIVKLYL